MKPPVGAQHKINNEYYKIGLRDMLFVWRDSEWVRSANRLEDIREKRHNQGPKMDELVGRKAGTLTVVCWIGKNDYGQNLWYCKCDCGQFCERTRGAFFKSRSCGKGCPHYHEYRRKK